MVKVDDAVRRMFLPCLKKIISSIGSLLHPAAYRLADTNVAEMIADQGWALSGCIATDHSRPSG